MPLLPCLPRGVNACLTDRAPCGALERALKSSHHGQSCARPPARSYRSWARSAASPGHLRQPPHLWSLGEDSRPRCDTRVWHRGASNPARMLWKWCCPESGTTPGGFAFLREPAGLPRGEKKKKRKKTRPLQRAVFTFKGTRVLVALEARQGCVARAAAPARQQRHLVPSARASCIP